MTARDVGGAGEDHARDARIADERGTDRLAATRQELQRRAAERPRDAAARTASCGDQRRLFGRLREHRIAGRERRRDFARRRSPAESSTARWRRPARSARRRASQARRAPARRSSGRKSTASRTSEMALATVLPASRTASATNVARSCLEEIGRALEACGARVRAAWPTSARPSSTAAIATARATSSIVASITVPTMSSRSAGIANRGRLALGRDGRRPRAGSAPPRAARTPLASSAASAASVASSARSTPRELRRPGSMATGSGILACGAPPPCSATRHGIGDERRDADRGIDDAVDERAVGAVLEQPPHEIREQRLVRADRRIDAAAADRACRLPTTWSYRLSPMPCRHWNS